MNAPGAYAFVRVYPEDFLRLGFRPFVMGKACGHPLLAEGKSVLYAGEVEFDENAQIMRWTNKSGQYRPNTDLSHQAGLPLDKFWSYGDTHGDVDLGDDLGWLTHFDSSKDSPSMLSTKVLFDLLDINDV